MVDGFTQDVALLEEGWAMSTGINLKIISYLDLFGKGRPPMKGWYGRRKDPIRLSTAAYADVATVLFDEDDEDVERSICQESESSGLKRKPPRSV
jgi:hypothetical protein